MLESEFKRKLILEIEREYPGAIILKNDANKRQGIPDHIILWKSYWAAFDSKATISSPVQPNQKYYIDLMTNMSFAAFVYPENKEWFLHGLQRTFKPKR